jgi:hypothetical protein
MGLYDLAREPGPPLRFRPGYGNEWPFRPEIIFRHGDHGTTGKLISLQPARERPSIRLLSRAGWKGGCLF